MALAARKIDPAPKTIDKISKGPIGEIANPMACLKSSVK